ncbi:hypothetical protein MVEN_01284100 [Mycena venus]|uniref:MULE transposase domain-containing protein n=1 Tax=Mycena venus TaxID=2733690 RepID=A0A8H6Y0N8_9AGAR|nr:hypothetical protein MVEN_01284100 [Mycena venus]
MESFDALAKRKITVLQNFKYLVWGAMTAVTAFSFHPTMSFALYGTPTPDTLFSAESFHDITIADADRIIQGGQLPHILPKGSLRAWVFDREVPTSLEELTVSANEHIPCAEDMLPITREMESAFHRGARSVCLNLPNGSVRYHLSKIRLIINVNNHAANLAAAASLLNHVESSFLLLPDRIQELKGNKFMEPLAGFHVTAIPLYTLGCLLNERWAKEDVLNARAELTYFHRAVIKDLGQDPSFLFIPTSFINDCRTLIKLPGSPYSQNIIWFRERVRSGSVNVIGFLSWTRDHYSALVKMRIDDLEHGDSLNLPPESDLLPLLWWALAGLRDFEPRADQTYIPSSLIDRQTSLAGEGSCGIAAAKFIEFRIGMDIPRWMADQSADFRDLFLQEMLLYHLIACCETTIYSDWVMPCILSGNGEVPGFTSTDVGIGYYDFNLDMPSPDMTHPIFDWVVERLKEPQIFPEIVYTELQLAELPLDHTFNFPAMSFGHGPASPPETPPPQPHNEIIVITDPPSPALPSPKTPPRRKIKDEDVLDLCSPDVIDLSLSTPPRLATKAEVIELISPFQPGVKRKHEGPLPGAKFERIDIDLSSPPRRKTKQDSSLSSRFLPPQAHVQRQQPPRIIELGFGPIQLHNVYDTFETAEQAIYQAQEALGHKWIRGQVRRDDNTGAVRRRTLRCNRYREPKETHRIDIDPSDHRRGKSGRTNCLAHVNLCPLPGGQWQISLIDAAHNHEPHVPSGGSVQRPPTAEHRSVAERFSDSFSRKQLGEVLASQFPDRTLEPRQISNMRNQARSEARQEVNRLGGDVQAILASLETLSQSEPGWAYSVQMDTNGVVTALWWQSPEQAQLTGCYTDILINDNSYNRNDKQYPLSIGIIVDSHGRSRNAWYAFQKKEDTESFAWILRCHLRATGDIHPELFVSDRSGALIAAVVLVLIFTFHIYCLSHLLENVDRNLGRVLGDAWRSFLPDFWACYRAVSPEDFETQWQALVQRYPAARSYLTDLYECRDRWAWAWISVRFTAGIRTNGRVEVENRITKTITGPGKTLFQVFNALNERTQEQKRDENIRVRDASRKQHPGQTERAFQPILDMLREHVGAFALQACFQQMGLAPFYNASALQLPHGVRDWSEYAIALNDSEPGFVWDRNEEQSSRNDFANDNAYIGTRFLLRLVREQGLFPTHVLKIVHMHTQATHILVLLPDGRYMCDCCMGTNLGVVCRHYLVAWLRIPGLPFHLSLIRARWFIDPSVDVQQIEAVTFTAGVSNHAIRFSAMSLPLSSISNPVSSIPSRAPRNSNGGVTPPPLTRTIPQRQVYAALQADFRAMVNGIQTQEQLDETRARIEQVNYQAQEDANQGRVRDPPTMTRKEREVELYWSEDRLTLADQPDVYLEFPRFLEDVVKWVADRRTRQTNRASNAMTLVRTSSDIFAGAGVYTITELWHMAGLSPNLTEAEVFDSPSRTARLCGAFYHFAKEAHTTLCERLQVYGKERSYVSARFHGLLVNFKAVCEVHSRDPLWVRRCTAAGPFDVFEPELIRHALEFEDINLGGLIFGEELWAKLHSDAGLPIACLSSDNTLARFYSNLSIAPEMSTSWLNPTAYTYLFHANKGALRASHPLTILYRAANTDIWSVIPAFPDNSAPIPRARPPQVPKSEQIGDLVAPATWKSGKPPKPKTVAPLVPKTTPMQQCNPSTRDRALLAYIIKFTQNFTVGPLDYCGIARRIKGRGDDM